LQNDEINYGMTFLLHGVQAYIYSSPEHSLSTVAISNPSLRMTELGQLSVGRIRGQLHTRNPDEYFPTRQLQFLLKADALQRRLYFLWPGVHPVYCTAHSLWDSESVCGCFGGCRFFDTTLEKNKYFLQLQQENVPPQATAASTNATVLPLKGSVGKNVTISKDEPDYPSVISTQINRGNSVYSRYASRRGSLIRQRQISAREDPLTTPSGVTCIHNALVCLSRGNTEDVIDYSSMMTLNRNSLNSLNNSKPVLEAKDDNERTMTPSSSTESFMSALSEFTSDIEEPSEQPEPTVVTKDVPNTWTSSVTFCPYIISTRLATHKASTRSDPAVVTILSPRYRSHLPSFLPKVSLQLPPDEVVISPVAAKVSLNIQLVEKCSVRLTSSVLGAMEW